MCLLRWRPPHWPPAGWRDIVNQSMDIYGVALVANSQALDAPKAAATSAALTVKPTPARLSKTPPSAPTFLKQAQQGVYVR